MRVFRRVLGGRRSGGIASLMLSFIAVLGFIGLICPASAFSDIIIDDGDPGTSFTGSWYASSGATPYNGDSLWSRNGSVYTWTATSQPSGLYEVFMWWSAGATRPSAVSVAVDHSGGRTILTINQKENAGQWNSLGSYTFGGTLTVKIQAVSSSTLSTCADAVRFVQLNQPPSATIDSITPSPAQLGQPVSFNGSGSDPDGTIAAFEWASDLDGVLSTSASFSSADLSWGNHTISFRVQDDKGVWSPAVTQGLSVVHSLAVDNTDAATSKTGTWAVSTATGYYGTDSVWSRDGATFSWLFTPPEAGFYEISMWSTYSSSRTTSAQVNVENANGTSTVYVNQQLNTSQWFRLGTFWYLGGVQYKVTIVSQPAPSSTCADAVQFVRVDDPATQPPVAAFSADITTGPNPLTVQFTDESDGTVTGRLWEFGDGQTSTEQDPLHVYASAGVYTVKLTVSNSYGSDTEEKAGLINVYGGTENIYLVDGYSKTAIFLPRCEEYLTNLGAVKQGDVWVYTNTRKGITYNVRAVRDAAAYESALLEPNAHIIYNGHSNFGLGATFGSYTEVSNQQIDDIYYTNDDQIVNYSTRLVSLKTDGMRYGQAYPNWNPVFKDGTSALAPYTFAEGTPPYNYLLTYRLPGDPTHYKIELADGRNIQRFSDSGKPAWYSATGAAPSPTANPEYFITNTDPDWSRCEFVGNWPTLKDANVDPFNSPYSGYNYQYKSAGTGANTATWTVYLRAAGNYTVNATWPANAANATNAKFTINHANGSTVVEANQQVSQPQNNLGTFYFNAGTSTIVLSDDANGRVIADSITLTPQSSVAGILSAEFGADLRSGAAPLTVKFTDYTLYYNRDNPAAALASWTWDFGDGTSSTEQNPTHTYESAGTYTVRLTARDTLGNLNTEEKTGLVVVDGTPALRAEFTATPRMGTGMTTVQFTELSSGTITGRQWDFGDGTAKSYEQNPVHTYTKSGRFSVTLTVRGSDGSTTQHKESNFVTNMVASEYVDNTFVEKPHYMAPGWGTLFGKVIVDMKDTRVKLEDMKFSRFVYGGCNSSSYYLGSLGRGLFFFTTSDEMEVAGPRYLQRYLMGDTDDQILSRLNEVEPIWQYYNFNLKPPSMR